MDLKQIAETLIQACRDGTEADLLSNHYAEDAVSVEAMDMGGGRETKGLDGIRGKHAWWEENFEMHSAEMAGPYLHGDDRFAVTFKVDATEKATGKREVMNEVAIYTVNDGKIVREEFYY